jgi:hypothetical protein
MDCVASLQVLMVSVLFFGHLDDEEQVAGNQCVEGALAMATTSSRFGGHFKDTGRRTSGLFFYESGAFH